MPATLLFVARAADLRSKFHGTFPLTGMISTARRGPFYIERTRCSTAANAVHIALPSPIFACLGTRKMPAFETCEVPRTAVPFLVNRGLLFSRLQGASIPAHDLDHFPVGTHARMSADGVVNFPSDKTAVITDEVQRFWPRRDCCTAYVVAVPPT